MMHLKTCLNKKEPDEMTYVMLESWVGRRELHQGHCTNEGKILRLCSLLETEERESPVLAIGSFLS